MLYAVSRIIQVYLMPVVAVYAAYHYGTPTFLALAKAVGVGVVVSAVVGIMCVASDREAVNADAIAVFLIVLCCGYYRLEWHCWAAVFGCAWYFWRWRPRYASQHKEIGSGK